MRTISAPSKRKPNTDERSLATCAFKGCGIKFPRGNRNTHYCCTTCEELDKHAKAK